MIEKITIEKITYDYLYAELTGTTVVMEKPEPAPQKYVLIEKIASSVRDTIRRATIAIQSYAPSLYEAASLNDLVIDTMNAIVETTDIYRCECNSDYNFTDTSKREYRYQAVFFITY